MKRYGKLEHIACLLVLLLATPAAAQIDPDPDGVGIYADTGAMLTSIMIDPGTSFEVYLIATNISEDNILAWNLRIRHDTGLWVGNYTIPYDFHDTHQDFESDGINIGVWNDIDAIPRIPLGLGPNMILLTMSVIPLVDQPQHLYIENTVIHTIPEPYPAYESTESWDTGDGWVELHPSSGSYDAPVFVVNGADPIATEAMTLGQVKALYR